MSKIVLSITLSSLLLFSGCTEKKKETNTLVKQETKQDVVSLEESNMTQNNDITPQEQKPFKPTLELNVSQEDVVMESLEELEAEAFKTVQPRIIEEMQKIPDCLESAENKEEAFACSQTLRELNKEISIAMGDFSDESPQGYEDDFIWDEETKINMIKEIEAGTQAMQEVQTCMETSKTPEALERCLHP